MSVKFYCDCCEEYFPVFIDPLISDKASKGVPWGDIICTKCHLVIATISADTPGIYEKVREIISVAEGMLEAYV